MAGSKRVEIIAVGSEMLTPYHQDTNSLELTARLNRLGLEVMYKSVVGDEPESLARCLEEASRRSDVIITVGGLGPTRDDITRETLARMLKKELILRQDVSETIRERFTRRGLDMPETNLRQAYVPEGADVLPNQNGTAPGLWLDTGSRVYILLPGPPREIFSLFDREVMPRLESFRSGFRMRRILKTTGLTESRTEALIGDLYPETSDLSLTVLASPGQIELHLTAFASDSETSAARRLDRQEARFRERLGRYLFSCDGAELEEVVGNLLLERQATLAVAESCTGGLLGHRITNVPGSSDYFLQGVQVYSNEAKIRLIGIPRRLIEKHGAVSREIAEEMAGRFRKASGTTYALAITGIAGPGGGSADKPVGLVHTALAGPDGIRAVENHFIGGRATVKLLSTQKALDMLRLELLEYEGTKSVEKLES